SLHISYDRKYETYALPFISKVLSLPTLHQLHLIQSNFTLKDIPCSTSENIQYLTIRSCSFSEYNLILRDLPSLQTIVIAKFTMDQSGPSKHCSQLLSLTIGDSVLSMLDFGLLLSLTPSLIRLNLRSYRTTLDSISNGSDWSDLIQTKLSNLRIFHFFFSYSLKERSEAKDLDLLINHFRTPFWLHEKQWIVTCDYYLHNNLVNIYTTPQCTMDFEKQIRCIKSKQASSIMLRFHSIVDLLSMTNDATESTPLTTLNLDDENIQMHDIKYLAYALQTNKTVKHFTMKNNAIGEEGARYIAEALRTNTTLISIDLDGNRIGNKGVQYLVDGLQHNTVIRSIFLGGNDIGEDGALHLAEGIKRMKTLTTLGLNDNQIGTCGAKYLSDALRDNQALVISHLLLRGNKLGDEGVQSLVKGFRNNTTISHLHLDNNDIRDEGARYLFESLMKNTTLTLLTLNGNKIGITGAQCLANALRNKRELIQLDLRDNNLGDQGVLHVIEILQDMETLKSLNLSANGISAATAERIYELFQKKHRLIYFDLTDNDECAAAAMNADFQLRNSEILTLNLQSKNIGDKGVTFIADALKNNTTLRELDLRSNKIGEKGAEALSFALRNNTILKKLCLSDNEDVRCDIIEMIFIRTRKRKTRKIMSFLGEKMNDFGIEYLLGTLNNNTTIEELELSANEITDQGVQLITDWLKTNR
ncbi:unnamed protein product, partial [Adineta ricciae]